MISDSFKIFQQYIDQYVGKELDMSFQKHAPFLIGIDEVGRGCLAGPVISCAISLNEKGLNIQGLNDSKKISAEKRKKLFYEIMGAQNYVCIGIAMAEEIDEFNIYQATLLSMKRSLWNLPSFFSENNTLILVDAMPLQYGSFPIIPIIKGDTKSPHIMAASIIAKVVRDELMCLYDQNYPGYGFAQHKGYATSFHQKAILEKGALKIHRKSFAPLKKRLSNQFTAFENIRDPL